MLPFQAIVQANVLKIGSYYIHLTKDALNSAESVLAACKLSLRILIVP